jgi:hypothetical protein
MEEPKENGVGHALPITRQSDTIIDMKQEEQKQEEQLQKQQEPRHKVIRVLQVKPRYNFRASIIEHLCYMLPDMSLCKAERPATAYQQQFLHL